MNNTNTIDAQYLTATQTDLERQLSEAEVRVILIRGALQLVGELKKKLTQPVTEEGKQ